MYFRYEKNLKKIYFCSELNPLVKTGNYKKKININEAHKYFTQGLINSNDQTWFENIHQVKASHFIEFSNGNIDEKKYYHIENFIDEDKKDTFHNEVENFKTKPQSSFKDHNQFDVRADSLIWGVILLCWLQSVTIIKKI